MFERCTRVDLSEMGNLTQPVCPPLYVLYQLWLMFSDRDRPIKEPTETDTLLKLAGVKAY